MEITIKINLDNAAFKSGPHELARILRLVATLAIESDDPTHLDRCKLRDINGNTVGQIKVAE